ncbi:SDR family NAD(P)-dependent oxidoreductase [Roseimaritima sediminicola]|uniref:SDR family NAD(P)-dependent oxidoreductase n=1 Tax=Roseimaritima sediminicola TaxID=2662066 RepID=UPI00192A2237|nr:SDR family oxidoreductase [Roseimaritima sediminicola]
MSQDEERVKPPVATSGPAHCVVTGASSGIGRATALRCAASGAEHVLVHYHRNESGARQTAADVEQAGARATVVQADLAVRDDRRRLVDAAWKRNSRVDAWFHIAGADVLTGAAGEWTFEEKLQRLWEVDVRGTIELGRQVAAAMLAQPTAPSPPAMLFIGWDQAEHGMEGDAGQMFGPIKAAVTAFSRSLAQTLAPRVRVNCVAPGWIQTAWGDSATDTWQRRAQRQALMQRWGRAEDVAAMAVHLCSPHSDFVTGQTIDVNGGWNRKPGDL